MKEYLEALRRKSFLTTVKEEISPDLELSSVLLEEQYRPLLFERVSGSSLKVAGNIYGKREYLALALGIAEEEIVETLKGAIENPTSSGIKSSGFKQSEWDYSGAADLEKLPILKHFQGEAGKYITAGILAAKFPDSKMDNLSFHRMLVLSKDKVALRIVPRHLDQIIKASPEGRLRVTVEIGPPPSVFTAASIQTSYGVSEYGIANKLEHGALELCSSELSDILIPVDSEIVLEGLIDSKETVAEGPYVDLTRTYDEIRTQPVIKFEKMHFRRNSVYQAVVASSSEHALFMGLPQELKIVGALSKSIPRIRGVCLTPSSNGYFHCIVSLEKSNDGDGKTAIMNCFAASHPLKLVVAVDSDVDPFNLSEVEWALATRFQADRGLVMISGAKGSSLDPSSEKLAITSKLGLDATLPLKADRVKFMKAEQSHSMRTRAILERIQNS